MNQCVECLKAKVPPPHAHVRWTADGNYRCPGHRAAWVEKQHAESARVASRARGHVGEQGSYL